MNIEELIRDNIRMMTPYSSARHEYAGKANIFLDANENPYESGLNRYPDPLQTNLKQKISTVKKIPVQNIFLGNGSDEAIDSLMRIFCRPAKDRIIVCPPTYGMYEVCAAINDIKVKPVPLTREFQMDMGLLLAELKRPAKLLFICSPNNPTGNSINRSDILAILDEFKGIVVLDEAYIGFSQETSLLGLLYKYPNLVILQTLSKAWGLAGLRLGMAFASPLIVSYMNKIKYPYNINTMTQQMALKALDSSSLVEERVRSIVEQREWLSGELEKCSFVQQVFPSDANFLWINCREPVRVYEYLKVNGIVIRYKTNLRISIGTPEENKLLIETLKRYEKNFVH